MKVKKEERVGVEFTTNEGYQVIIIDYVNVNKVQVMFLDEHKWTTWADWSNLKKGKIKNPFHKSIYGVGYLGLHSDGSRPLITGDNVRPYVLWNEIIRRCYDEKSLERKPTYRDVTVCDRWHSFALFLEDLPKIKNYELWLQNENERVSLNKDLFYTENGLEHINKVYSLETCQFLTQSENVKEVHDRKRLQMTIETH